MGTHVDPWEPDDFDLDALGMSTADWRHLEESSLTYGALAQVESSLARLPVPPGVADALSAVLTCAVAHSDRPVVTDLALDNEALLDAAAGVGAVQGFADGVLVQAARTLADRAGTELLARKHASDPAELSVTARERWRGKTKAVVAQELSVLTGLGVQSCHARVGFALAPPTATGAAETALRRGAIGWRGIGEYWQRCRAMDVADAATVADKVFTPLLTRVETDDMSTNEMDTDTSKAGDAAAEDTNGGTTESHRAESWPEFNRRLSREVTRVKGTDAAAARARRRAAVDTRDVSGEICDEGLASVTITGGTASTAAALERIETVARRARKAGDPRRLGPLRSDIAMALLVHGAIVLPDVSGERVPDDRVSGDQVSGDRVSPSKAHPATDERDRDALISWTTEIQRILSGMPAASIEIVVPIAALGQPACRGDHSVDANAGLHADRRTQSNAAVGEITGHGFVTAEHARELLTIPGSTWHRLLTDSVDGRVIERSTAAYRPDQAMIDQVRAADRTCRAPGCMIPAHRCELDHESPFGSPGGVTSETNLNPKHARHHQLKTEKFWTSVMNDTRQVTWTTLFKKMYITKPHDYREYDPSSRGDDPRPRLDDSGRSAVAVSAGSTHGRASGISPHAPDDPPRSSPVDPSTVNDSDLRDRLVYAALSARGGQDNWLEAMDDQPVDADFSYSWRPLAVFHRHHGRRRPGPPLDQLTVEELLVPSAPEPIEGKTETQPPPPPPF